MSTAPNDKNLWRDTTEERVETTPLNADTKVDLVIIGGGYTGCSAALTAAIEGASVVLLEASTIGHGGSGRNVGLVNAGLWTPPGDVEELIGQAAGRKLNSLLAGAPDMVFGRINHHGIACEPVRHGTLHLAGTTSERKDLQNRRDQLTARGAPVTLLGDTEARSRTGCDQVVEALFDPRAGTIQPLAYCIGLARAAQEQGAVIHEHSPVSAIARDGDVWRVSTNSAAVTAKALLIATNAYHLNLAGEEAPAYTPVHYFQLATKPLSNNLAQSILPGQEGCWDAATVMTSIRKDAAGRVIIGGVGGLDHGGARIHTSWAKRKLSSLFPQLDGQELDHVWFGRIAMTSDHLPKIRRLGPNGFSVFGYSGRGIGPGTLFGDAAARVVLGADEAELPVEPVTAHKESFTGMKRWYYETGAAMTHFISR